MAKYVSLLMFTDTGIKNLRKTTARADAFAKKIESEGIKILATLWTVGQYDLVHIFEAENDVSAATFSFALSALGNVRTNPPTGVWLRAVLQPHSSGGGFVLNSR